MRGEGIISQFRALFLVLFRWWILVLFVAAASFFVPPDRPLSSRLLAELLAFFDRKGITFVALGPADGFLVELYLALALGALVSLPYALASFARFFLPALYPRERRVVSAVILVSAALFIVGFLFGVFVVFPPSLDFLLMFNGAIGIESLYSIRAFVAALAGIAFFSGALFTLPVCMVLLSLARVVSARTWLSLWRPVVLLALIASAIITPDGTGVTMLLLAVPVITLYFAGFGVAWILDHRS